MEQKNVKVQKLNQLNQILLELVTSGVSSPCLIVDRHGENEMFGTSGG